MTTTITKSWDVNAVPVAQDYKAEAVSDWASVADAWAHEAATGAGAAFQQPNWLRNFYEAAKLEEGVAPLIVTLRDAASGLVGMRLPLVVRKVGGRTHIEFADLGMTDFNAPLLGPAAPATPEGARAAFAALKEVLPRADILNLTKMPPVLKDRPNPLALRADLMISAVNGNLLTTTDDLQAFRKAHLERDYRMENERRGRGILKKGGKYVRIEERAAALATLDEIEAVQRVRMEQLGQVYKMDDPVTAAFHRSLIANEIENGFTVLTAIRGPNDEFIAALMGVLDENSYIMIRLTQISEPVWNRSSPGRSLIEYTIAQLHAKGVRKFDFSVGNFSYKRRFRPTRTPLYDIAVPLSAKGFLPVVKMKLAGRLRRYPVLRAKLHAAMGKSSLEEVDGMGFR